MGARRVMVTCMRLLVVVLAASVAPTLAHADSIEDFYRGKQIKIYVRAAPGGNYDVYSRVLGRHIVRHIPGNPSVLTINMPGGGGVVALNYVANAAPRDGTVLTMITQSFPMDQALGLNKAPKIDLRTLGWIGNMSDTNEFLFTPRDSSTKTLADARRRQTAVAATGIGSIVTQLAGLYNNMLGLKLKVIYGYPSGPAMTLAMERGEVEGRSTSNPQVLGASNAEVLEKYNFLIQTGMSKVRDYESVPLLRDFAANDEQRQIFDFISASVNIARPIVTNAGVPAERIQALRRAFDATLADPAFREEAQRQRLDIDGKSGEELERLVRNLLEAPTPVLEQVRKAIQLKDVEAAKRPGSGQQ
jgi:tripartite-type tricarboxylate transporter receptor subunit TctC